MNPWGHGDKPKPGEETLVIVVHLPQPMSTIASLLRTAGELWPDATVKATSAALVEVGEDPTKFGRIEKALRVLERLERLRLEPSTENPELTELRYDCDIPPAGTAGFDPEATSLYHWLLRKEK